jgi:hypothetical protein
MLPDHKLGLVLLTNSMDGSSIIDLIAERTLREALTLKAGIYPPPEKNEVCVRRDINGGAFQKIKGDYTMGFYGLGSVKVSGKDLSLNFMDEEYRLVPCADGYFSLRRIFCGFIPGKRLEMRVKFPVFRGRRFIISERDGEVRVLGREYGKVPVNRKWAQRAGGYLSRYGKNRFSKKLEYRAGVLYWGEYVAVPANDNEMVLQGFERNYGGETVYARRSGEGEFFDHRGVVFVKRKE